MFFQKYLLLWVGEKRSLRLHWDISTNKYKSPLFTKLWVRIFLTNVISRIKLTEMQGKDRNLLATSGVSKRKFWGLGEKPDQHNPKSQKIELRILI